jgi:LuxR family maltose regulon positive regulatory protein
VPQLKLVLLTRADPALPLHRLRVAHELAEIRPRNLSFTAEEAIQLIADDGVTIGVDDATLLVERTEGWPAGLRLAALFLRHDGPPRRPSDFAGDDEAVVDYLGEEVLASHPPAVRRFLLRTSVAERVSSGLAQVLTDEPRSQQYLEGLARSNTFVVGLGPGREWYRYHPLLREMLRHRLMVDEPDVIPELQRAAARWFAEHGHVIEALHHAADADDWELLGRQFVTRALPLAVSVERTALDGVLSRIPQQHLADGSELSLAAATRHFYAGRFDEMEPHLTHAEQRLASTPPETRTAARIGLRLLSTPLARSRGDNAALIRAASDALDDLSGPGMSLPAAGGYRVVALGALGTGLLWSGQLKAAETRLLDGLAEADDTTLDATRINMLAHLGLIAAAGGRLRQAHRHATHAVETVEARGWAPLTQSAAAYLALSTVHLAWNNPREAETMLAHGLVASGPEPALRYALGLGQVRLNASLGRGEAAREHLRQLRHHFAGWEPPWLLARWSVVAEAEVDLVTGDPAAAMARIGNAGGQRRLPLESITLARAMLGAGHPAQAQKLLTSLRDSSADHGSQVELWLLAALAADGLRERNRASECVRHALEAAEPEGIRRPFVAVDPGTVSRLLTHVAQLHPTVAAFADELLGDLRSTTSRQSPNEQLARPLTERELNVLQYLPTMMTNTEIAAELFVSVNTVKAHVRHVYEKLDVVNRRQAVHRARELGLLLG